MAVVHPDQMLGLPSAPLDEAQVVVLPVPFERTVSYGTGTWRGPRAILDASCQVEFFDEEAGVDFETEVRMCTVPAVLADDAETAEAFLQRLAAAAGSYRGRFVLGLGGEHLVTFGLVAGLADDLRGVTVIQLDAHADLALSLEGKDWSHGTVMRRLVERGVRLVSVGVRSLSRQEHEFAAASPAVSMYYAHQLPDRWDELVAEIGAVRGPTYLTIDADGLDPSIMPGVGTPQPDGLSWRQVMQLVRLVMQEPRRPVLGADVVEFVASPHPPGWDLVAAKLACKVIAFWYAGQVRRPGRPGG